MTVSSNERSQGHSPSRGSARGPLDPELPALLPGLLLAGSDGGRGVPRSARDWFVDVVCFLFAIVLGLIAHDSAMSVNLPPDPVRLLDLGVGALACVTLWWRRRWPVELAVALGLLSAVVAASAGAALVMLLTVAVHRRFTIAAAVAVVHIAAGLVYYVVYPDPDMPWQFAAALLTAMVVAITAWGMFVRARRQLVLSLRERADQAEAEAALRVDRARHLERERIAREMHDVLAHRISLLSVHAGALEYRPDAPKADIVRAASVIRASAHQALQDLREVIGVLRTSSPGDDPDRPQPSLDQLAALVEESRQAGMKVDVDSDDLDRAAAEGAAAPPPAVARCAYRVVQEGLTNARKHARGAAVRLAVNGRPGHGLTVEIHNLAPVGAATRPDIPGAGTGLVGLAERVELAGGRLEHGRTPAGGFRVRAWLPWPA